MAPLEIALDEVLAVAAHLSGSVSAAVFLVEDQPDHLALAATYDLAEPAAGALAEAVRKPEHPVTRTATTAIAGWNVRPRAPGGPALRSHLPLTAASGSRDRVVGVVALAHQEPLTPDLQPVVEAAARLLAAVIEREG
jgi:GAF domain-containing protein